MTGGDWAAFDRYAEAFDKLNRILEDHTEGLRRARVDFGEVHETSETVDLTGMMGEFAPRFDANHRAVKDHAHVVNRYMNALNAHMTHLEDTVRFCREHS